MRHTFLTVVKGMQEARSENDVKLVVMLANGDFGDVQFKLGPEQSRQFYVGQPLLVTVETEGEVHGTD